MLYQHRTHRTWAVLTLVILFLSLVLGPAASGQTAPASGTLNESTLPPVVVLSTPLPVTVPAAPKNDNLAIKVFLLSFKLLFLSL